MTTQKNASRKQAHLSARSKHLAQKNNTLDGSRVYLSGPMDFVASRAEEKKTGWRNRINQFLQRYNVTVYDPWNKPEVAGMKHYGKEDEFSTSKRQNWNYDGEQGDKIRAQLSEEFWPTLHIDLRMVDTSDFLVAYVPTNIYSVGTVHEIVMARLQNKPVLFVSPRVEFPSVNQLESHFKDMKDTKGQKLFNELKQQLPIHENPKGDPSMWYMALVDAHYFFDGFGFEIFRDEFEWEKGPLDEKEILCPPKRPLLPYLKSLSENIPKKYDLEKDAYVENQDWLIFEQNQPMMASTSKNEKGAA